MRKPVCRPLAGKKNRTATLEDWQNVRDDRGGLFPEEGADLGRELRRRLLAYGLEHCLTEGQRQAVELCLGEGLTMTVAARRLGVCPSTVSRRLSAAMARLRGLTGPLAAAR